LSVWVGEKPSVFLMACGGHPDGATFFPEWELMNVIKWSTLKKYGEQY